MSELSLEQLQQELASAVLDTPEAVEAFRRRWIGRKSVVAALMQRIREIPPEQRRAYGQQVNALKAAAEAKFREAVETLKAQELEAKQAAIDVTLDGVPLEPGAYHPLSVVMQQVVSIFRELGFETVEGPEIVDDWHNFTALNTPEDHPAREMQDTFYVHRHPDWLLRTHTSAVQVYEMERRRPPLRIISPGRVYRNETISARAHCIFHQVEGLYIDTVVTFADLKQTLYTFVQRFFGTGTGVRFRPSYFPFTEPSAEMDIACLICHGKGCSVCKHTGWVEILGCGMVDPQVLLNCNIDPAAYQGFAFGMGIERLTMLKYGIDDIRLFFENDHRFLTQFTGL